MRRMILVTLALLLACSSDSTGNGSPANVVIVNVSIGGGVSLQNNGGAGQYFVEWWGPSVQNAPGGGGQIVRLAHTDPAAIEAGGTASLGNPAAGGTVSKIRVKTRAAGNDGYFTTSCYGSCP